VERSSILSTVKISLNTLRDSSRLSANSGALQPGGRSRTQCRQSARLRRLSEYLHSKSGSLLMFETPGATRKTQVDRLRGDKKAYDLELRPRLMADTIRQLQNAEVEPDVWKIDGLDRRKDCEEIVAAARRDGRDKVGCITLGRDEDNEKVHEWLATASRVPGFIGFAVGRTSFWDALVQWRSNKITRERLSMILPAGTTSLSTRSRSRLVPHEKVCGQASISKSNKRLEKESQCKSE